MIAYASAFALSVRTLRTGAGPDDRAFRKGSCRRTNARQRRDGDTRTEYPKRSTARVFSLTWITIPSLWPRIHSFGTNSAPWLMQRLQSFLFASQRFANEGVSLSCNCVRRIHGPARRRQACPPRCRCGRRCRHGGELRHLAGGEPTRRLDHLPHSSLPGSTPTRGFAMLPSIARNLPSGCAPAPSSVALGDLP